MPIYEYRCESCAHEFERFQQRDDDDPESCPECKHDDIKRLISNTSFQLKGSGWYETDYARDDESTGADATAADGEDAETEAADEDASDATETKTTEEVAGDPEPA